VIQGRIFAHQWIQSGNDLVDFSVGDWREDGARPVNALEAEVSAGFGPIKWTAPELLDFFWAPSNQFAKGGHPELGEVRYTQFMGIPPDMTRKVASALQRARPHLIDCCKQYAFDERLSAVREERLAGSGTTKESIVREGAKHPAIASPTKQFLVVAVPDGTIVTPRVAGQVQAFRLSCGQNDAFVRPTDRASKSGVTAKSGRQEP
jgi:hypothetical protein